MKILSWSVLMFVLISLGGFAYQPLWNLKQIEEDFPALSNAEPEDVYIVGKAKEDVLEMLNDEAPFDYETFFLKYLHKFKDVPYGAGVSNSVSISKTLVCTSILNCVTFIEMYWAINYTRYQISQLNLSLNDNQKFNLFLKNLNFIKFYDGLNCELHDRIHYFTDALYQLQKKGLMEDIAVRNGMPIHKKIEFITLNKKQWAAIKNWKKIQLIEQEMTRRQRFYYPIEYLDDYKQEARTGDIIALATDVKGLDVSHCGYITFRNDSLLFSHASSVKKKVVIEEDLCAYLSRRNSITGIYVYRPLFNRLNYYTQ